MPKVTVNGVELSYADTGAPVEGAAGTALVFHHGYTSSGSRWDAVVSRLRDRYRCVTFDARGTGESAAPASGYTMANYAADVLGLADVLELAQFTFVGHSMGGGVGFFLAAHQADRLEKLILMAPVPANGGTLPRSEREDRLDRWRRRDVEAIATRRYVGSARGISREQALAEAERELSASEGHMVESLEAMEGLRLGERLPEMMTPTLMLAGAADALLPYNLHDFGQLGNATLHVFSRVGHGISSEVPAAVSRVIPDFLEHGVITAATLAQRAAAQEDEQGSGEDR